MAKYFLYNTYSSSEQLSGLYIRYPMDSTCNNRSGSTPGYGELPKVTNSQSKTPKLQTSLLVVYK